MVFISCRDFLGHLCKDPTQCMSSEIKPCIKGDICEAHVAIKSGDLYADQGFCRPPGFCNHEITKDRCNLSKDQNGYYSCCCSENRCNEHIYFNGKRLSSVTPADLSDTSTVSPSTKPFDKVTQYSNMTRSQIKVNKTTVAPLTYTTLGSNSKPINSDRADGASNILIYILPVVFGICIFILFAAWCLCKRKRARNSNMGPLLQEESGNLLPLVEFQETIYYGNFGCVKKAYYQSQLSAIKCLNSQGFHVWESERNIHSMFSIEHESIVKFIAAEKRRENNAMQYWIVTEFCEQGSLFDFLHSNLLDFDMLLNASLCISNGLAFLHAENRNSVPAKPSIVHFDLKSKNILVKDRSCKTCISDFGLATVLQNNGTKAPRMQVGTPRYMAPELLEGVMSNQENDILAVDVYALSLVMWELLSRCNAFGGSVENYVPPFHEFVRATPTVEDMRLCVVENKHRPSLKTYWLEQPVLRRYATNIEESWDADSDARLTAECIYERLKSIRRDYYEQYPDIASDSGNIQTSLADNQTSSSLNGNLASKPEECHQSLQELPVTDTSQNQRLLSDMTV